MKAKLSLLFAVCFFSISAFAQTISDNISHIVEPGQTLYFISKKYNLSIDQLRKSNPQILEDLIIKPDQVLTIPVKNEPTKIDVNDNSYKVHVVKTKETLFSIAQMYGVKVTDLISLNNLESANINIGQELRIEKLEIEENAIFSTPPLVAEEDLSLKEKKKVKESEVTIAEDVLLYKELFDTYAESGNQLNKDKGIGNYLDGNSSGAYLAMVNNVPANQIVKVRNLMNNKVIYLKVVGPVSTKDADKNIAIKISKSAANDLNIIEDRFLAEWTWYTLSQSNEEGNKEPSATFDDF